MGKKYLPVLFILLGPMVISCGGGSSSGGSSSNPGVPTISASISKTDLKRGQTVDVTMNYKDPDGDINVVRLKQTIGLTETTDSIAASELGIRGTEGTVVITLVVKSSAALGTWHNLLWVEDAKGNWSNQVQFDVNITGKESAEEKTIVPLAPFSLRNR